MDALHRGGRAVQQLALDAQHLAHGVDQEGTHPFSTQQQAVFHGVPQARRHGGRASSCAEAAVDALAVQAGEIVESHSLLSLL